MSITLPPNSPSFRPPLDEHPRKLASAGECLHRVVPSPTPSFAVRSAGSKRSPWLQKVAAKVHLTGYVVGVPPEKADAPAQILATFGGVDAFRKIVLATSC
jgi:hypothetical protein